MEVLTLGTDSNDAMLRTQCTPVQEIDDEIRALIEQMQETVKVYNGIGLAAPQVGVPIRVFVVYIKNEFEGVFINPEIIETSKEMVEYEEGCLSIPGVYETVIRSERIRVQYLTVENRRKVLEAEGILARVILHEHDHLNGVLFTDRLSKEKEQKTLERYERKQRAKNKLWRKKR